MGPGKAVGRHSHSHAIYMARAAWHGLPAAPSVPPYQSNQRPPLPCRLLSSPLASQPPGPVHGHAVPSVPPTNNLHSPLPPLPYPCSHPDLAMAAPSLRAIGNVCSGSGPCMRAVADAGGVPAFVECMNQSTFQV